MAQQIGWFANSSSYTRSTAFDLTWNLSINWRCRWQEYSSDDSSGSGSQLLEHMAVNKMMMAEEMWYPIVRIHGSQ